MGSLEKRLVAAGFAAVAASLLALLATSAFAHHSFAMFDDSRTVVIDGTIREFQWTNPHSWIQVSAVENGKTVEYSIEGSSPNGLARKGWTRQSLKPGDHVKLSMHPLKDGTRGGSFTGVTLADGASLTMESGTGKDL
jgi:hypothetical protein